MVDILMVYAINTGLSTRYVSATVVMCAPRTHAACAKQRRELGFCDHGEPRSSAKPSQVPDEIFLQAITMPQNLIYSGVLIIASKLYTNSVLAVYVLYPHPFPQECH